MTNTDGKLILSVDMDEWYHGGRWVHGQQRQSIPDLKALFQKVYGSDRPIGEIIEPTRQILALFKKYQLQATFFVLGEVVEWYPHLIREIADHGHEIACHGMHHVDMTVLGPKLFAEQLDHALELLKHHTGQRPIGYRAPNLVYESWATQLLEERGILYDSSVCPSRSISGKYKGWENAPSQPYFPDYDQVARPGQARLVELPVTTFPLLKLPAGSGIAMRMFGYQWSMAALRYHIRHGHATFYFHPFELGRKPPMNGSALKRMLFLRHMGPWTLQAVERIIRQFDGRVINARTAATQFLSQIPAPIPQPQME
jgi:peptidoglycan-N-acetylglucosamine deacetylase